MVDDPLDRVDRVEEGEWPQSLYVLMKKMCWIARWSDPISGGSAYVKLGYRSWS
jgi:hypothetical protein